MPQVDGVDVRFFVVGMGRSGTRWLAKTLQPAHGVRVTHEGFWKFDRNRYTKVPNGRTSAEDYISARMDVMRAWQKANPSLAPYGDVNGYLRYIAGELRDAFGVPVAGLIREGTRTVRSLLFHNIYKEPHSPKLNVPQEYRGDQFASCCWYWADTYRRLMEAGIPIYRLEDLNADYDVFYHLCDYLRIDVLRADWERMSGVRVGVKIKDREAPKWDDERMEVFKAVAGDIQEHFYAADT